MERPQRLATGGIASLAILGSVAIIWWRLQLSNPKIDRTPIIAYYSGMGQLVAGETVKIVHDQGRIVLVSGYDHNHSSGNKDDLWEAFHNELKNHVNIHIIATEVLPPDADEGSPPSSSPAAFAALLERQGQVDAIVFFMDLPEWNRVSPMLPSTVTAKIIVVYTLGVPKKNRYSGYFTSGFLSELIYPKQATNGSTAVPGNPQQQSDKNYQIATPQNYGSLAD